MHPLFLAAALAAAQPAPPTASADTVLSPVTVTASRDSARRALQDCLARSCPPAEDMRLTLRSVEADFLAGEYKQARLTLDSAIGRNRRHARKHPVLLAGLYKADNTVNRHLGRGGEAHRSARSAAVLLADRYGRNSEAALWARLDSADALLNAGRTREARARYLDLAREADAKGSRTLKCLTDLRLAWLPAMAGRRDDARRQLQALIDRGGPDEAGLALAAAMLKVKLEPESKQDAAAAAAIGGFRTRWAGSEEPVLLWSPVLDQKQEAVLEATLAAAGVPPPSQPDPSDWIDVGFFVDEGGRVQGAQVLRAGKPRADWHAKALDLVKRRVYAPAASPQGPAYRVERLALTALVTAPRTGTHLPGRRMVNQLHAVDLTAKLQPAPPAGRP